jgi:hypothetical protein
MQSRPGRDRATGAQSGAWAIGRCQCESIIINRPNICLAEFPQLDFRELPSLAGALLVSGDSVLVAVSHDPESRPGIAYANLKSGELVRSQPQRFIWFENWSIEIKGPEDYRHFYKISVGAGSKE